MTRIGVLYKPHVEKARLLADTIRSHATARGICTWLGSAWDEEEAARGLEGTDLVIGIGGDGTLLHCARVTAPRGTPDLGVKLGQLGFITEINEHEVEQGLPRVMDGEGWIEERAMLKADCEKASFLALNDAVVRCTAARLANVSLSIDDVHVTTYRADGVIVSSATGSTGYSMAAGGPVLMPESTSIIVQPICTHIGLRQGIVLPETSKVGLTIDGRDDVVLSIDGQIEQPLAGGGEVTVCASTYKARFLRLRPRTYFYGSLHEKLGGTRT